jgi:hypothetical protein
MIVRTLNWLVNVGEPVFFLYLAVCIFILLPMTIFRRTRTMAAVAVMHGTWLSGAILWIFSVAILYDNWGWSPVILGIALGGIGAVPIAWVLSLWNWLPSELGDLAILTAGTFLPRLLVIWLIVRSSTATPANAA